MSANSGLISCFGLKTTKEAAHLALKALTNGFTGVCAGDGRWLVVMLLVTAVVRVIVVGMILVIVVMVVVLMVVVIVVVLMAGEESS